MPELEDEQNSEMFDVSKALDVARRRHLHFLIPLFAGWLLVWGASWLIQPRYKSNTLILVEQPTMPSNYVQPNVSDDLQDRLQSITQQIMSRTRLVLIIDKLHLYDEGRQPLSVDEKVDHMRKDINIELVHDSRNNEISAFRISYLASSPQVAQKVTSELTDLFINENLRVREQESQGTTNFIESQLEDARAHLSEQEAKVHAFQSMHEGSLPDQQASNLEILSGLQSQLQNEQDALNTAKQQKVYLQAMIEQNRPAKGAPRIADPAVTELDQQLTQLRAQLTDLSSRYTDKYPDVQRVKAKIATTERQRADLIAKDNGRQGDGSGSSGESSALLQLQGSLQANQLEISNREQAVRGLEARIGEYQGRLNGAPSTEQELADLTRGYDQSKANYDDLLKKKNESAMATSMEQMQQGERFTMLDPASLPAKPDFPNRLKFCGIGLAVGLALGLLVAGTFEWIDDRMYDEKEIKALLPQAVISEIPEVIAPSDEQRAKKRAALKWAMTAAMFVIMLAGAAFSFLHA
jgi:polysaccharide chain length determinant protein (PEP-CTERM system associated)